jgi:DNA replication protein DnaC
LLTHPTCDRLEAIGLTGMAQALHEQRRAGAMFESLSFEERLGLLVDREAAERGAKRLATRLRFAALRHAACVEDIDMRSPRGIDAAVMAHLIDGGWINRHENLLITGPTGLGKSWIASETRLAGMIGASSITACPACSRCWPLPEATGGMPVFSRRSNALNC